MTYREFNETLKKVNLSKKRFADLTGIGYFTIFNWKHGDVPKWAESWLNLYIIKLKYDIMQLK
ncbi:MAG: XRE family transcriptional regulator [Campylobacteraceae bacterium]|jgi:hypothetical protein|nr:XRE family transcriptional regulator [Campylobacteraceae bacterium]